jgi:hypothetical protein
MNKNLLNCKFTKFTVGKINLNVLFSQNFFKNNLPKEDNRSLKSKFVHMQIVNKVILNIKNIDFKKSVCFSLTSENVSNHVPNKALYKNDKLRKRVQFLNGSQAMVLKSEILNGSNTTTDSDCLNVMNLIEKEGSEDIITNVVDNTIGHYKDYIINHIHNCNHKICYECFNISKSPEGELLVKLIKMKVFYY